MAASEVPGEVDQALWEGMQTDGATPPVTNKTQVKNFTSWEKRNKKLEWILHPDQSVPQCSAISMTMESQCCF